MAAASSSISDLTHRMRALAVRDFPDKSCLQVMENVHEDDIHCILPLGPSFVTGSKDGMLKLWSNEEVKCVRIIHGRDSRINYKLWVTALTRLNDDVWLSGTRSGKVYSWNNKGTLQLDLKARHAPDLKGPRCKERNEHRVNCLASFEAQSHEPLFFVGWPKQLTLHSADRVGDCLNYMHTDPNDWVYVVRPLNQHDLLVVIGCRLELWKWDAAAKTWQFTTSLIQERARQSPRPYISALTPLTERPNDYGLAVFDGSVRVYDLEKRAESFCGQEHLGRVWTIENISPFCFASCADDGRVKLWDVRQSTSTHTFCDNVTTSARVSVLLRLDERRLLSGSCPDDVRHTERTTAARFTIRDLRG